MHSRARGVAHLAAETAIVTMLFLTRYEIAVYGNCWNEFRGAWYRWDTANHKNVCGRSISHGITRFRSENGTESKNQPASSDQPHLNENSEIWILKFLKISKISLTALGNGLARSTHS